MRESQCDSGAIRRRVVCLLFTIKVGEFTSLATRAAILLRAAESSEGNFWSHATEPLKSRMLSSLYTSRDVSSAFL